MSCPGSPRIRMRPIGPGAPMRRLGAPRSTFAGGASLKSGRWPSRVWITSIPAARAPASSSAHGPIAARSSETSLPSVSPKPPGSMKSRCMSMTTSALRCGSIVRGAGTASIVMRAIAVPSFGCERSSRAAPRQNGARQRWPARPTTRRKKQATGRAGPALRERPSAASCRRNFSRATRPGGPARAPLPASRAVGRKSQIERHANCAPDAARRRSPCPCRRHRWPRGSRDDPRA